MIPVLTFIISLLVFPRVIGFRSSLSDVWLAYADEELDNRRQHADLYQESLESFKFQADRLVMLELGVNSGRSMLSWIKWFSDVKQFVYVGVDKKPFVKFLDISDSDTIHIEVRSELDDAYLNDICSKYGPFDVITDNGGTSSRASYQAAKVLFPCMSDKGYYFLDSLTFPRITESFENRTLVDHASNIFKNMHNFWVANNPLLFEAFSDPIFSGHVKSIETMHNVLVLERAPVFPYTEAAVGNERVPFRQMVGMQLPLVSGDLLNINMDVSGHSTTIPHETIKAECRGLCEVYQIREFVGQSVEECARKLKQKILYEGFVSNSDFIHGDDPVIVKT